MEHQDIIATEAVVNTLFTATDAKDWGMVRSLFIEDIDVNFSGAEAEPKRMTANSLVSTWEQGLHAQK